MTKIKTICLSFLITLLGCDLPHQPGPMPTDIVETEFQPGLNILGVLRADGIPGSSFININRALTTEEIYSDSIEDFSPEISQILVTDVDQATAYPSWLREDSSDWGNYVDSTLIVEPGQAYELHIDAPGFPTLQGVTLVPELPRLVPGSLVLQQERINFILDHDASSYEYHLYLVFADQVLEKVVVPAGHADIPVSWSWEVSRGVPAGLILTAFDENLTRYGNSPISFIPNTYHPDASTVSGGYGCFGSVSVAQIQFQSP